nr:MAG TPA: hypothetical protein [Bacteriophage sp.]
MKYDFSKCNNLQFKAKGDEGEVMTGYLKVAKEGEECVVYVFFTDCRENESLDSSLQIVTRDYERCEVIEDFNVWAEEHDLEIVPRGPETYKDWKVGDRIRCMSGAEVVYDIAAKLGEVVFLSKNHSQVLTLPINILVRDFKLILTDYEKELIHAQELEEKKKECQFKEGDRVLVRDEDGESWDFGEFVSYYGESTYPYDCKNGPFVQCIPLNEHTWNLLGTMDEYKEEE